MGRLVVLPTVAASGETCSRSLQFSLRGVSRSLDIRDMGRILLNHSGFTRRV